MPYGIDLQKEIALYDKVCRRKENYMKYLEWEAHVISILPKSADDLINLWHYLNERKRRREREIKNINSIILPIYMFLLSFLTSIMIAVYGKEMHYLIMCWMIIGFLLLGLMYGFCKNMSLLDASCDFYADFMRIVEKHIEE